MKLKDYKVQDCFIWQIWIYCFGPAACESGRTFNYVDYISNYKCLLNNLKVKCLIHQLQRSVDIFLPANQGIDTEDNNITLNDDGGTSYIVW